VFFKYFFVENRQNGPFWPLMETPLFPKSVGILLEIAKKQRFFEKSTIGHQGGSRGFLPAQGFSKKPKNAVF